MMVAVRFTKQNFFFRKEELYAINVNMIRIAKWSSVRFSCH